MKTFLPLLLLLAACTGAHNNPVPAPEDAPVAVVDAPAEAPTDAPAPDVTQTAQPGAALQCDAAAPKHCVTDADCACGTDKATSACAFGTAACIDTEKQCPDFCRGITGSMVLSCNEGTCAQSIPHPPQPESGSGPK